MMQNPSDDQVAKPSAATDQAPGLANVSETPLTAASLGLIACHHCGTVWQDAKAHAICQCCHGRLLPRKINSIQRTWALLITASILYIPANLLPVLITKNLLSTSYSTIMGGVLFFWAAHEWFLATIIFVASILVPMLKLATLSFLLLCAQSRSAWRLKQRAKLYRMVEIIGRWSMLDVFVVAILAGLVQLHGYAEITPGIGILAFGAVVILTMLASLSFDPRLTWDYARYTEPAPVLRN